MRKLYLLFLVSFTVICATAQRPVGKNSVPRSKKASLQLPQHGLAGNCTIFNYPAQGGAYLIPVDFDFPPVDSGYVTGINVYDDQQEAQYFNAFSASKNYINGAAILFGAANSTDNNAKVSVNVYAADGDGGSPNTLLGSTDLTIGDIKPDVAAKNYTIVTFNPAIAMPVSKKFYVSVDMSNLSYYKDVPDTLGIVSSFFDSATGAWNQLSPLAGGGWYAFKDSLNWNFDMGLYIFPYLGETASCDLLPVHLLSFNAAASGKNVLLNWKVTQEAGMKEYGVERAGSDLHFAPAGTVPATNSRLDHSYSFTDHDVYSNGTVFYRLKQVDKDGKIAYSNVISLAFSNTAPGIKVVNPFKGAVELQINAPVAQKLQGGIYDMLGRKIINVGEQVLSAGQNSVTIPAGNLPKGVYILNITVDKTSYKYKIIN